MFHTITNVQTPIVLQQYIDNRNGDVLVGLRSVTYTVGWYNVGLGETLSSRRSGSLEVEGSFKFTPGFYKVSHLRNLMQRKASGYAIFRLSNFTGLITLQVNAGWELCFTDGLLALLNLDDGLWGTWLDGGTYKGDRAVSAGTKTLSVYLHQLSTTANFVDGAPSTLLALVGLGSYSYGDTNTIYFACPEFKPLIGSSISELEVTVCDDTGSVINNHQQRISLGLEFIKQ